MSGFELAILLSGIAALAVFTWAVDRVTRALTHLSERIEFKLEKSLLESMHQSDQLREILNALQK